MVRVSDRSLALMRVEIDMLTIKHQACKRRHNDQRQLVRWLVKWDARYGLSLERIVQCYWTEILAWMSARNLEFVPLIPHVVVEMQGWLDDQDKAALGVLLTLHGLKKEDVFVLRRTAIQRILMESCVKRRVRVVAAGNAE